LVSGGRIQTSKYANVFEPHCRPFTSRVLATALAVVVLPAIRCNGIQPGVVVPSGSEYVFDLILEVLKMIVYCASTVSIVAVLECRIGMQRQGLRCHGNQHRILCRKCTHSTSHFFIRLETVSIFKYSTHRSSTVLFGAELEQQLEHS
jgi:hypothetical protein